MFLLYLDDSGSVGNVREDYFVLAGVTLPENSIRWCCHELETLAEEIWPDAPRSVEFHASEIFGGRGAIWSRFNKEERILLIKRVISVLDNAHSQIRVFACAVHKASFPGQDPVELAFEDISSRFDLYLQRISTESHRERGLIVLDRSSYENSLQSLTHEFRRQGNRWGNQLRGVCEVPLFVDSQASRIIQLADHIAYAVFRFYNAADASYFNLLEGKFDEHDGVFHGLSHRQSYTHHCMCPACLSRRYSS